MQSIPQVYHMSSFNRQEVLKWERLDDNFSIDFSTSIGKGSYGVVYRGYSRRRDALIAIKVVRSTDISKREIDTLRTLSALDHPNIMGFYGELELNGNTFLLLEYCDRGTLADLIKQGIPETKVLKLFREMVEGMCYMNAKEQMHRDLKPENILIGPEIDVKICDFGLAQTTNSIFVTGRPEVFLIHDRQHQTYTYTCDVWSAALILYEMLSGEKLFKEVKDYKGLKEEWLMYERGTKRAVLPAGVHPLWEYFMNWMLQFDYRKRPTFHVVLQQLKRVYDSMQASLVGIQSKAGLLQQLRLEGADRFIRYQLARHDVLVSLCEKFTSQDIRMENEYKYTCMFFCLLRYTRFAREFIRALRYRRVRADGQDLIPASDAPELEMFCDRARFPLEHRYDFYSAQLASPIVTTLQNKYRRRPESRPIMHDLQEAMTVVDKFTKSETMPEEQDLREIFRGVIATFHNRSHDFRKLFGVDEMRLYAHLLMAALLDDKFPEGEYERIDVRAEMQKIADCDKEQLERLIDAMHEEIER